MIRILIAFVLLTSAPAAIARPVPIQTGEHPDFTRIVLSIPAGTNWELGRTPSGYRLNTSLSDGFDLRRFYDLIPNTRAAAVKQISDSSLEFDVPCNCHADAFMARDRVLVIDIRDGEPDLSSPFEMPITAFDQRVTSYSLPENNILPLFTALSDPDPTGVPAPETVLTEVEIIPPRNTHDLAEIEEAITSGLAQGLTRGTLDEAPLSASMTAFSISAGADHILPGVAAHSNLDPISQPFGPQRASTQTGAVCLPDELFDIASWGDDRSFSQQLGESRRAVIRDIGTIDEDGLLQLVRTQIYFGFGAEAQSTLLLSQQNSQERFILDQLASILDHQPTDQAVFAEHVSCPSLVALWAMLSSEGRAQDSLVHRDSILANFKSLPTHLQSLLGARLAEQFIALGDEDAALQFLPQSMQTTEDAIAEAKLFTHLQEDEAATTIVTGLARDSYRVAPDAMTAFLNDTVEREGSVATDGDFLLADVLRFENAGTSAAHELFEAQFNAYLAQSNFDGALTLLESETSPGEQVLWSTFAAKATAEMADGAFLQFAFEYGADRFSSETINAIGDRLLNLGFADRAENFGVRRIDEKQEIELATQEQGRIERVELDLSQAPLTSAHELISQSSEMRAYISSLVDGSGS
ncbi:hypothetical protein [Loktanella sp. S4079]|uniref:hypothetical protein n=1 Tax=Loktanella sp. S4079 TaxID=579483 RepID=UPI0005FA4EB4|nr:hypothetical protein [Loktanella sp. S4079]KJZ21156.1 hypothetical protein TW80_00415 [Loktanella sp. S4079]